MDDGHSLPGVGPDGRAFPVHAQVLPDRGRGALLGLAVGDALGTTLEFSTPAAAPLPARVTGPHTEVVGKGPFRLAAGQVTDDSQMAALLAASLMERGCLDPDDVARRYVAWTEEAFDIGGQTGAALYAVAAGEAPLAAGRGVWEARSRQAAGNGSLMRTTPIGLFFAGAALRGDRLRAAVVESAITHFDPRCRLACAAFDGAIAAGVAEEADPREMAAQAVRDLDDAARLLLDEPDAAADAIRQAHEDLREDVRLAMADDPRLYGPQVHLLHHQGYVRVAFRLALWHLLHTPSFEDALIDVVNRGGDADTNGAITGALLGAAHGEAAIPARWRQAVLDCTPPAPWNGPTHPRALLALVRP